MIVQTMRRCSALLRLCQLILRTLENVAETAARNEDLVDVDVMERVHVCVMFWSNFIQGIQTCLVCLWTCISCLFLKYLIEYSHNLSCMNGMLACAKCSKPMEHHRTTSSSLQNLAGCMNSTKWSLLARLQRQTSWFLIMSCGIDLVLGCTFAGRGHRFKWSSLLCAKC